MKKIILIGLLFVTTIASAQLSLNIGAQRTQLDNSAITIDISYLRSLDSLFGGTDFFVPGKKSFLMVAPELDLQTGTDDALSSIVVKASGLLTTFKTTTSPSGLITPDFNKTVHVFPISIGVESNASFNDINGIFEVGWEPFYQSYSRPSPEWVKRTRFGIYLQGGYKFESDTTGIGGEVSESEEPEKRGIFRAHGTGALDTEAFITIRGLGIGLVGSADGWADIVNSAFYYKLEGRARVYLTPETYFDFVLSKGSGAPLFNEAAQGGISVGIKF